MRNATAFVLFFIAVLGLSTWGLASFSQSDPTTHFDTHVAAVFVFIVDLLCITGIIACIGWVVTGSPTGIAINGLDQYSLSRLQMAAWTIIILAGLLTYARLNIFSYFGAPIGDPLQINIPPELLEAMGIAAFTTSAVPAILALKESQNAPSTGATTAAKDRFAQTTGTPTREVTMKGLLMNRTNRNKAAWIDMVTGDEAANAGLIDVSKVQQLLITLLLLCIYIGAIIAALSRATGPLTTLPKISQTFIGLLALSHAGYLAYKIAPKATCDSDTTPTPPPPDDQSKKTSGSGDKPGNTSSDDLKPKEQLSTEVQSTEGPAIGEQTVK